MKTLREKRLLTLLGLTAGLLGGFCIHQQRTITALKADLEWSQAVAASSDYARAQALEDKASWQRTFELTSANLAECMNDLDAKGQK